MGQISCRTQIETEVLRKKVLMLFLEEHLNQYEIAERVGKTQSWVSRILRACREEYRQFNGDLLDKYQAMEIDKCNAAEAEAWKAHRAAWKAWKRSIGLVKVTKKIAKAVKVKGAEMGVADQEKMSPAKLEVREEMKVGNPMFLNLAIKAQERAEACAARRCRLLGYDGTLRGSGEQPRKNDRPLIPADMTNSDLMKQVFEFFHEYGPSDQRGNGNGNGNGNGSDGHHGTN